MRSTHQIMYCIKCCRSVKADNSENMQHTAAIEERENMGTSNKESWYKLLIAKMDQSIENKYYFEAIFIEYMIIDDRIKSLADFAGVPLMRPDGNPKMMGQLIKDLKAAKKTQVLANWKLLDNELPLAEGEYLEKIKTENYPQDKVKKCTRAPRQLINFEQSAKTKKYLSKYRGGGPSLLGQISEWVTLRNHWMHAAGDDALTLAEYEADITPLAIDGASFTRELCDIARKIKREIKQEKKRKKAAAASTKS